MAGNRSRCTCSRWAQRAAASFGVPSSFKCVSFTGFGFVRQPCQVAVDLFIMGAAGFVDAATLREVPHNTGGQLYHYEAWAFEQDEAQLFNDLRWNLMRPQVKVQGLQGACMTCRAM